MHTGTERIPKDQDTDPETARSELDTQTREAIMDTQGHAATKPQSPSQEAHSRGDPHSRRGSQSWFTGLTNLEIGISSQGFIDQPVTPGVPWAQVHDVTLCLLVCQRHRWKLARTRRKQG